MTLVFICDLPSRYSGGYGAVYMSCTNTTYRLQLQIGQIDLAACRMRNAEFRMQKRGRK